MLRVEDKIDVRQVGMERSWECSCRHDEQDVEPKLRAGPRAIPIA